jgi:hypothetical protein
MGAACSKIVLSSIIAGVGRMLKSVAGVYQAGRIELLENPPEGVEGKVIVTFLNSGSLDLAGRGIDPVHAADLRRRLNSIADDWDRPEMDAYDAV